VLAPKTGLHSWVALCASSKDSLAPGGFKALVELQARESKQQILDERERDTQTQKVSGRFLRVLNVKCDTTCSCP
jgi:hypothetical protein